MLSHIVLITTKDKNNADKLLDGLETLRVIPHISMHFGKPVPSDRAVVDSNYTVGIAILFENQAALDFYANHPVHIKFMEDYLVDVSVKVYDFE